MDILKYKDYLKFAVRQGKQSIYDPNNKQWRKLEPEELVRQCLYQFLIREKQVPEHMIKIEYSLHFIDHAFRADLVIFDRKGKILAIAECKSFKLTLQQKHLDQIALYNQKIKADFLILTNGRESLLYNTKNMANSMDLMEFPCYSELISSEA